MRIRTLAALAVTWLALLQPTEIALSAEVWSPVTDGIEYRQYLLPGPKQAFVARMDRSNPNLVIDSMVAQGQLASGTETVSGMAQRYDGQVVPWDHSWQQVGKVAVAINGIFYDPNTGIPETGMIQSGWYIKRFDELGGTSGFAFTGERETFLGGCIAHEESGQKVSFLGTGEYLWVQELNTKRPAAGVGVFTPQFGPQTPPQGTGVELLVEMTEPAGIVPQPRGAEGYIRQIRLEQGETPIPFDHIVISARGSSAKLIRENTWVGQRISVSQELMHLERDCRKSNPWDWSRTFASIGGSFYFLTDGEIDEYSDNAGAVIRNPRTMVCFNDDYIFFAVVDGRQSGYSVGMTADEMGQFCRDELGADWGINQDGGGSSAMWVNGQLVNRPSDGAERPVANGLMMMVLEPAEQSTKLSTGQSVETTAAVEVRLGPGGYPSIASLPEGSRGIVLPHINGLNGVEVRGSYWWKVAFEDVQGWVQQDRLHGLPNWAIRIQEILDSLDLER